MTASIRKIKRENKKRINQQDQEKVNQKNDSSATGFAPPGFWAFAQEICGRNYSVRIRITSSSSSSFDPMIWSSSVLKDLDKMNRPFYSIDLENISKRKTEDREAEEGIET